jgi:hypothetical protein
MKDIGDAADRVDARVVAEEIAVRREESQMESRKAAPFLAAGRDRRRRRHGGVREWIVLMT